MTLGVVAVTQLPQAVPVVIQNVRYIGPGKRRACLNSGQRPRESPGGGRVVPTIHALQRKIVQKGDRDHAIPVAVCFEHLQCRHWPAGSGHLGWTD
jgi:hypothetical protein